MDSTILHHYIPHPYECVTCSVMLSMRYRSGWTMRMICCSGWLFNSHMENTRSSRRVLVPVRRAFWRTKHATYIKYIKWLTWEKTTMYRFGAFCLALFPLRNRFDPFNWLLNDVWLVSESLVVYVHTVPPPVWAEQVHIEGRDAGRQGRSGRRAGCLSR